jgi:hypothetical protein
MNYFNLPQELDALLRSVSIVRPKTTWHNLPAQLRAVKVQLLLANEDLENNDLAIVLASIPNANFFNYLSVTRKIKIAINIIN